MSTDPLLDAVRSTARRAGATYTQWTTEEDIYQHLAAAAYGKEHDRLLRWIEKDEWFRVSKTLFGWAKHYAEREKATKTGYNFDDVAWYTPARLRDLIPLAVDPTWDGLSGETGTPETRDRHATGYHESGGLLTMIVDCRRALEARPDAAHVLSFAGEDTVEYHDALVLLADHLGGEFPKAPGYARGRRRVQSNATALSLTSVDYAGVGQ